MLERTRRLFCRQSKVLLPAAAAALPVMALLAAAPPPAGAQSAKFEFAVLGDTDYSFVMEKELPKMLA